MPSSTRHRPSSTGGTAGSVRSSRAVKVPPAAGSPARSSPSRRKVRSASSKSRLGEGEGVPGLEDALLGAEQQPVPVDPARLPGPRRGEPFAFGGTHHQLPHAFGQRGVRFGVDAQRQHVRRARQRRRPVSVAVREAADDAVGPQGHSAPAVEYGDGFQAEPAHGPPRAGPRRREVVPALRHAPGDQFLLLGEEGSVRHGLLARRGAGDVTGQQPLDHREPPEVAVPVRAGAADSGSYGRIWRSRPRGWPLSRHSLG